MVRLDNNIWGYNPAPTLIPRSESELKQIQIITPQTNVPGVGYELSKYVIQALKQNQIHYAFQLTSGFVIDITSSASSVQGRWKVTLVTHNSLKDHIRQFFPFTRTYRDRQIAQIAVSKDTFCARLSNLARNRVWKEAAIELPSDPKNIELTTKLDNSIEARLYLYTFQDPFSLLARRCLRTVDPYWVSEQKVQAAFRYVWHDDGTLNLKKIASSTPTAQEKEENRKIAQAYKEYYTTEFGIQKFAFANAAFGFSLDEIIKQGLPLVPDHIFKMNIAAASVDLSDVQRLYDFLMNNQKVDESRLGNADYIALREYRALKKQPSMGNLPKVNSVRYLPRVAFNKLVAMIMPTEEDCDAAFVGRMIRSLAISAGNTMGDANVLNPSRNFFELMHLFPQMRRQENWTNFYELLSHVATKKALYQKSTIYDKVEGQKNWHVGLLLPAPTASDGSKRYYYTNAFFDDGEGNESYFWLPACNDYSYNNNPCPFIEGSRATCTNPSSMDWLESIRADLNPFGSPCTLDPQNSYFVEKKYFDDRTIPLWYGYLLAADRYVEKQDEFAKRGLAEYLRCIQEPGPTPQDVLQGALSLQQVNSTSQTIAFLKAMAARHNINLADKIPQDIVSIGHSLGGGLAAFDLYYYGARRSRLPLPGYKYVCYSNQGTGIDTAKDALFMNFGRTNSALISLLGPRWEVGHPLEFGDFNPQAGQSHLGTTGYNSAIDSIWLNTNYSVLKPQPTAQAKEITTLTTHSRRIGMATVGRDYTLTPITPQILSQFDHSWWMGSQLNSIWGYRILRSSKVFEGARRIFSALTYPLMWLIVRINNYIWPPIGHYNKNGLIYLRYSGV